MGKFSEFLKWGPSGPPIAISPEPAPTHKFSLSSLPAIGEDTATWTALVSNNYFSGVVTREQCMRIPAVKRARDIFCSLGMLPIHSYDSQGTQLDNPLLSQPERLFGHVRSVTMARTIEDLFYDGYCLWYITERYATGFPASVQRIPIGRWNQDTSGTIRINGSEVDNKDIILFESPNDPILKALAPAVRMLSRLEATADLLSSKPEANEYFTTIDGAEPSEDDIRDFLAAWASARRSDTTAFIPPGLERHEIKRMTAEELSLIGSREFMISEVSRATGISPNWLALNITSRTYSNMQDERRDFIDFPAAPYIRSTEERLSAGDVTPRGQYVRWNLDAFLRANTLERMQAYQIGLAVGAYTAPEIRDLENRPPQPPEEANNA